MYKIALCDDDTVFSLSFKTLLSQILHPEMISYELTLFSDTSSLIRDIKKNGQYHLIFLDILFESENGIDFAKLLREQKWNTDIIFITSNPEYALESYDTAPLHYLMKPLEQAKLEQALNRFLSKHTSHMLCLNKPGGMLQLPVADILYFEIYGHEILIHKKGGGKETCTGTLKEVETLLPPITFVRPHRSYLVNIDSISEIVRYRIRLTSGAIIPVSKALYNSVQHTLIEYASRKNSLF